MKEYYVIIADQQRGPFTLEQLAELGITPDTEVWTQGMADWQQAGDVAELTPLLQQLEFRQHVHSTPPPHTPRHAATSAASESEPQPAADAWQRMEQPAPQQPRSRSGVKWLVALVCLLLVVTLLAVTCPTPQQHKDKVANVSSEWLNEKAHAITSPLGELAPIVNGVVDMFSSHGIRMVLDRTMDVDNYVVCSLGRITMGDNTRTISLGVLGHVFTFNKEDVDQFLLNAIKGELGLNDNASSAPKPQVIPPPSDPVIEEDDDSYLAEPIEDDSTAIEDDSSIAQEVLDSLAATAKREVVKGAKKWVQKQLEKVK